MPTDTRAATPRPAATSPRTAVRTAVDVAASAGTRRTWRPAGSTARRRARPVSIPPTSTRRRGCRIRVRLRRTRSPRRVGRRNRRVRPRPIPGRTVPCLPPPARHRRRAPTRSPAPRVEPRTPRRVRAPTQHPNPVERPDPAQHPNPVRPPNRERRPGPVRFLRPPRGRRPRPRIRPRPRTVPGVVRGRNPRRGSRRPAVPNRGRPVAPARVRCPRPPVPGHRKRRLRRRDSGNRRTPDRTRGRSPDRPRCRQGPSPQGCSRPRRGVVRRARTAAGNHRPAAPARTPRRPTPLRARPRRTESNRTSPSGGPALIRGSPIPTSRPCSAPSRRCWAGARHRAAALTSRHPRRGHSRHRSRSRTRSRNASLPRNENRDRSPLPPNRPRRPSRLRCRPDRVAR